MKTLSIHEVQQVSGGDVSVWAGLAGSFVAVAMFHQVVPAASIFSLIGASIFGGAIGDLIYDLDQFIVNSTPAVAPVQAKEAA